jgi:hypothetical protein
MHSRQLLCSPAYPFLALCGIRLSYSDIEQLLLEPVIQLYSRFACGVLKRGTGKCWSLNGRIVSIFGIHYNIL